jgi:hypothetical protein
MLAIVAVLVFTAPVAAALPLGRHYEMVSQLFKGGYGVRGIGVIAPDGERVVYASLGAFAGAPTGNLGAGTGNAYLASRTAAGWSTSSLVLPALIASYSPPNNGGTLPGLSDISANFEEGLFYAQMGPNAGEAQFGNTETALFLHLIGTPDTAPEAPAPGPYFEVAGRIFPEPHLQLAYIGSSPDFSHLIVHPQSRNYKLTPEAEEANSEMINEYDLMPNVTGEHWLRMIGVNNESTPKPVDGTAPCPEAKIGALKEPATKSSTLRALSDDGREIFFWTCTNPSGSLMDTQVFVRLNGERTLEVSRPFEAGKPFAGCVGEKSPHTSGEVPCQGAATRGEAEFVGASEDGTRMFYMTGNVGLVSKQKDDLYMVEIGCLQREPGCGVSKREIIGLTHVSEDPAGPAEVQGVIAVSPDGSRVYYVAQGVLSGPNSEGRSPVAGADNLYVYHDEPGRPGSTAFIADLCTGALHSGEEADISCPVDLSGVGQETDQRLWTEATDVEAQLAGADGRFLVFASFGRLTNDDVDNARDVYRYDAQNGTLERVSVGEVGFAVNGNTRDEHVIGTGGERNADAAIPPFAVSGSLAVEEARLGGASPRAISEDGSRIVFTTAERLSPDDTNGLVNAYEWHEGSVTLVSSGNDTQPVGQVMITPSGKDVFFKTVQKLVPQDTDEQPDVYDAREGEGFTAQPAAPQPCLGDACQGPLTNPAPLLVPGSASQTPGENLQRLGKSAKSKKKVKPKKLRKRKRASHARRKGITLSRTTGRVHA